MALERMEKTTRALKAYIEGDLDQLPSLKAAQPRFIRSSASDLRGNLVVTRAAVNRVLGDLRGGVREQGDVQAWASFVRWGLFSGEDESTQAIDIDFEYPYEDAVVEVVGRLDELGDAVDGVVPESEIDNLVSLLVE